MANGLITIPGNENVGKSVDSINANFKYLNEKMPAGDNVLEQAKEYTNTVKDAIVKSTDEALQARVLKESGKGLSTNDFTDEEKSKLSSVEENANNYIHPTYTSRSAGIYKFQVNSTGHIANAVHAEKSDITAMGIPSIEDVACYGTCITDGGNPTKSVTLDGFKLALGKKITVIFTNANTANGITINVNGTGAKPVYYAGFAMTHRLLKIPAQTGIDFIYDGANWVYCGQESYVYQNNVTDNANYRLLLSYTGDNAQERASVKKSSKFIANPSTGTLKIDGTVTAKRFISTSTDMLLYSNSFTASSATIDIPNLFTNYSAVVCNAVTTSGKYSVTLPLAYIKSLGTSEFYEADGLLFYYVDDSTLTVKTGLGQSNPTINSIKIINLY